MNADIFIMIISNKEQTQNSSSIVELYKHSRSARGSRLRLVLLRTFLVLLKIPACLYNSKMHSARFLFL